MVNNIANINNHLNGQQYRQYQLDYVVIFFCVFNCLRLEVVVHWVDIGDIVDHSGDC
jgi:hypothetical protein